MADRYWRGGTGTWNTSSTTNWSDTSGGTGGFSVPTAADNVIFDQAATYTVTMTDALTCLSITVSAGTVTFATGTAPTLAISGGMSLVAATVWSSTGTITFNSTTAQTITTNGVTINGAITFNGVAGNWSLGSALTTGVIRTTTLTNGTLTLNGFDLTTGIFSSSVTSTRVIEFGTNNIVLSHTTAATVVLSMATLTGFTYTGTGGFSVAAMSNTRTFTCGTTGGTSTNAPNLTFTTGASVATISTTGFFNKLDYGTTTFTQAASTLNVNSITLSSTGTYTALILNLRASGTVTGNGKTTAAITLLDGSPTISGTITCTTFTVNGPTFNFTSGTLNPSTSFVVTTGGFTLNGGTLGAVPTFTHTAGAVTFSTAYALTATGTYTFTAGTLTLGANLTTGIFSSTNTNTRSIAFGTSNIILATTTAAQTVLSMAIATGFTYTSSGTYASGTGGFESTMSTTRTFVFGTTGGSAANAPSLYLVSGASVPTITTASWWNEINFGTTAFTLAATSQNISSLYSGSSTSVLTALTVTTRGTGSIQTNTSIGPIVVNASGITTTIVDLATSRCSTLTITLGTLVMDGNCVLICTGGVTLQTNGTLTAGGLIQCTTFTIAGGTYAVAAGCAWTISTSIVITSGSLTANFSAAGGLGSVPTFTHTAGTVIFNTNYSLTATGTYTFTAGTLTLADGVILSTGIFSSTGTGVRSIAFGSASAGNIDLTHTTAATVVLSMAIVTNFTYTGPGGFTVADMANTRTLTYGTTGGSTSNAVNLTFTTGASVATLTTAGWFKNLNFGTTGFNPGTTTLNIAGNLTLSSTGTYTTTTITPRATATYIFNGKSLGPFTVNTAGITITLGDAGACTVFTMTLGTVDFASFNFTCSSTATVSGGTLSNFGTFVCTTFTNNGNALSLSSGAINASVSFVQSSGSFTVGAATLGATPLFTHTAGTVTFNSSQSLAVTGTYTFTAGTLNIDDNVTLSTGIFSSSGTGTRAIAFGSTVAGNINLTHTTATTVVLSMGTVTGFSYTGLGGFTVADMANTRTLTYGTTGGSLSNAVNLTFTTGASIATLTTAGWFNNLDFGTTSFNPGTTALSIAGALTLSSAGTYTGLTFTPLTSATYTFNGASVGAIAFNYSGITITMGSDGGCTTLTMTAGTIDFAGYNFTCSGAATYNSTGTLLNFGTFACTTFTNNGATLSLTSGAINASTSFVQSSGSFTVGGSATIGATPLFTHTAGTVTFNTSQSLAVTGTYTFTAGTLNIDDNVTLSTGIFSSTNTNARTINFGITTSPGYIALTHTTAATVVLSMATVTGLTINAKGKWDGTTAGPTQVAGGFRSETTVTRTFTVGTTGGNSANAPCLYVTGTGATQLPTFTTGSWFGDFRTDGLSAMTIAATTLNVNSYAGTGYYNTLNTTSMSISFRGSGFINNAGDTDNTFGILGAVTINHSGTTAMIYALCAATTVAFTAGTLECRYWANGPFNGYGQFKLTGAFTQTGGTWYGNAVYIESCTTYTINGATVSFDTGSITATTSMVLTSGSFTFNGGTLSAVPTFTHTNGTATFNYNYSLAATGTYTLTAGTLTLADGVTLAAGIFSSTGAGTRAIAFGSASAGNINLTHTTAATVVLSMAALGGFSWTGPGGFTVADMANTRTFSVGNTSGGSTTTAPNLTFTTGASVATLTTAGWFNNLDFGTTSFTLGTTSLNIDGNLTLSSSGTYTGLTAIIINVSTITTNAKTIVALTIGSATLTGTATLAGNLTLSGALTLTQGSLDCSTYAVQSATFASTGALTRSITGSGTYTITGAGATAFSNASATGITITGLIISMTAATAKTFAGGGGSYSTLNQGGAGALTISGDNSFSDLTATTRPSTITFTISTTQTFTDFTLSGTAGNLVTINSSTAATQATLSKSSGTVSVNYLSIRDSAATGGAGWYAGTTSTNVSNNTGWIFTAPPVGGQYLGNFFAFF